MLVELEAERVQMGELEDAVKKLDQNDRFVLFPFLFGCFGAAHLQELFFQEEGKPLDRTVKRIHQDLDQSAHLGSSGFSIADQSHMCFGTHDLDDVLGFVHQGRDLFIPFGRTQVAEPLDRVVVVVSQLMDFAEALPQKVQVLDFHWVRRLGLQHPDALVFYLHHIMIGRRPGLNDPLLFKRVWSSRACPPQAHFFVLKWVNVTENDNPRFDVPLADVS